MGDKRNVQRFAHTRTNILVHEGSTSLVGSIPGGTMAHEESLSRQQFKHTSTRTHHMPLQRSVVACALQDARKPLATRSSNSPSPPSLAPSVCTRATAATTDSSNSSRTNQQTPTHLQLQQREPTFTSKHSSHSTQCAQILSVKTCIFTKALTRGLWECKTALASVVVAAALLLRQLLWTATWLAAADGEAEACEGGVADSTIQGPV